MDGPELTKIVCTRGPGVHFCARVQDRDLLLGHRHRARILAWALKKTLVPSEYRTRAARVNAA